MPALPLLLFAAATAASPDSLLASVDKRDTPGCMLDVRRAGMPIAQRAYGMADLETDTPIGPDTVFEIGSVSKQFIGAGLAALAADGRLSLDDRIRRWLPELTALYDAITVRMMLNHTSGIRSWNNLAELTGIGEDSTGYDNAWVLRALARQRALNNRPGAEYLYSNSNFVLGAIIIERASGQTLNAFFRARLFGPLGMASTQWRDDFRRIVPDRAQAYAPADGGGWRLDMPFNDVAGAGGLLSTAADLQRWNAALAHPAPRDRAWIDPLAQPGRLSDGTVTRYGLGLELDDVAGTRAISHAGSTASYRAWLGRLPERDLSLALLCNAGSLNTEDLGPELVALFVPPHAEPAKPAPASGPIPPGIAGLYRNRANDSDVEVTADATGLHFNGGAPFVAERPDLLTNADHSRTARVHRTGAVVTAISLSRIANAPVELVRVAAWHPSPSALSLLAGKYESAEGNGTQTIALSGDHLDWIDPTGHAQPLEPLYRDAFRAPQSSWTLRFIRDRKGRITALHASITRARQVAFMRRR